jgi:Uma2 family endonuclease
MDTSTVIAPTNQRIDYPERDGKPVGETDVHRDELVDLVAALKEYFRHAADVYISGNLMFYYEEGIPSSVVSPDVFVVKGVAKKRRRIYKLWEEQVPPTVVIELSSRSTRLEDLGNKKYLYAMLGVQEYYLFDPLEEYLHPPFQGYQLHEGDYIQMAPNADGRLYSAALDLQLGREGSHLVLLTGDGNQRLLSPAEEAAARRAAQAQVAEEAAARRAAQAQVAEEAAARRAAEERAAELATEVERLREELARLRGE